MNQTDLQFDQVTAACRDIFKKKLKDYGSSWRIMGHKAMTVCCIIANRRVESANTDYKPYVEKLVQTVLDRI